MFVSFRFLANINKNKIFKYLNSRCLTLLCRQLFAAKIIPHDCIASLLASLVRMNLLKQIFQAHLNHRHETSDK